MINQTYLATFRELWSQNHPARLCQLMTHRNFEIRNDVIYQLTVNNTKVKSEKAVSDFSPSTEIRTEFELTTVETVLSSKKTIATAHYSALESHHKPSHFCFPFNCGTLLGLDETTH